MRRVRRHPGRPRAIGEQVGHRGGRRQCADDVGVAVCNAVITSRNCGGGIGTRDGRRGQRGCDVAEVVDGRADVLAAIKQGLASAVSAVCIFSAVCEKMATTAIEHVVERARRRSGRSRSGPGASARASRPACPSFGCRWTSPERSAEQPVTTTDSGIKAGSCLSMASRTIDVLVPDSISAIRPMLTRGSAPAPRW